MSRPWLAPLLTVAGLACAAVIVAVGQPQPPHHAVSVCEYVATSGPHGAEAMTCTTTRGDR